MKNEFVTEKKVTKALVSLAINIVKAGVIAVVSGALILRSKKYVGDAHSDATQVSNIIKTAFADAKDEKEANKNN